MLALILAYLLIVGAGALIGSRWPRLLCLQSDRIRLFVIGLPAMASVLYSGLDYFRRRDLRRIWSRTALAAVTALLVVAFLAPNVYGLPARARRQRAMADLRSIGTALEAFAIDHDRKYPTIADVAAFGRLSKTNLPELDSWGHPYRLWSTPDGYVIVSHGECGEPEVADPSLYQPGPTTALDADIVYRDGDFFRYPEGIPR